MAKEKHTSKSGFTSNRWHSCSPQILTPVISRSSPREGKTYINTHYLPFPQFYPHHSIIHSSFTPSSTNFQTSKHQRFPTFKISKLHQNGRHHLPHPRRRPDRPRQRHSRAWPIRRQLPLLQPRQLRLQRWRPARDTHGHHARRQHSSPAKPASSRHLLFRERVCLACHIQH